MLSSPLFPSTTPPSPPLHSPPISLPFPSDAHPSQEELSREGLDELHTSRGTSSTYGNDWTYMEYDSEAAATPYRGRKFGRSWERAARRHGYVDAKIADKACLAIDSLQMLRRPFFLGVGFVRPHLPWSAPAWAWALHDATEFRLPIPLPPTDTSELSLQVRKV